MELVIIVLLAIGFVVVSALNRYYALLGVIAGIGLVMVALSVQTSGIQIVHGQLEAINTTLDTTTITPIYKNLTDVFTGVSWLGNMLSIVLGGIGLLVLVQSVLASQSED
jgi:hypothetical protein